MVIKEIDYLLAQYATKIADKCGEEIIGVINELFDEKVLPASSDDTYKFITLLELRYNIELDSLKLFVKTD